MNSVKSKIFKKDINLPFVTVIVPVLNEENYIENFINSIISQDYPKEKTEIIFADGGSKDNTKKIINKYINSFPFIKLIDNPRKKTQFGLNLAIKAAKGEYIVRMDAHAYYFFDYISKSIEFIKKTNAQNAGGPTVAEGKTRMQKIIAAAYHSIFATGGGKNHDENYEGFADTVSWGIFEKNYIISLGMYDKNLAAAEDDDLNFRIGETGGKIFITPEIRSVYYPRKTIKCLFKQYFNYGLWKTAVIKKHKKPARITHLIPFLFVLFLIFYIITFFINKTAVLYFSIIMLFYFALNVYFSFKNKKLNNFFDKCILIWVHFIFHISYGLGFLTGIFKFWNKKFKNFDKNIEFSKEKLRELQLKSLDLLLKFKKFCENNNLRFFLCGGCCIGAVRHNGFIPWDDDIDIFMPRQDYEKLYKICNEKEFYCVKTTSEVFCGHTFTSIIDKNSILVKREQIGLKIPLGISIDVFPLDGRPPGFFAEKFQIMNTLVYLLYTVQTAPKNHGRLINLIGKILLIMIPGKKLKYKIAKYCEKNMSKYKISECRFVTELCAGPIYINNKYPKEIFESAVEKKFENCLLPIPAGYDEYMRTAFGDYMKLPPEDERKPSHDIVFLKI